MTAKELFVLIGCKVGATPKLLAEIAGISPSAVSRRYNAVRLKKNPKRGSGLLFAILLAILSERKTFPSVIQQTERIAKIAGLAPRSFLTLAMDQEHGLRAKCGLPTGVLFVNMACQRQSNRGNMIPFWMDFNRH